MKRIIPEVFRFCIPFKEAKKTIASWVEWYVWTYDEEECFCMYEQVKAIMEGLA